MNEFDITVAVYLTFMVIAFFSSYKYGSYMTRKTGWFFPQLFIAGTINIVLGMIATLGWIFFSWGLNEYLFFGGLLLGLRLWVVGEVVLIILLLIRRKQLMKIFNNK
ncbi:MAG: hypothetical protein FH758_01865 [Firmicutes bacterium]|nr:hypothetical protein [Bacillota bacterium]